VAVLHLEIEWSKTALVLDRRLGDWFMCPLNRLCADWS
jgi:hypothetical protein